MPYSDVDTRDVDNMLNFDAENNEEEGEQEEEEEEEEEEDEKKSGFKDKGLTRRQFNIVIKSVSFKLKKKLLQVKKKSKMLPQVKSTLIYWFIFAAFFLNVVQLFNINSIFLYFICLIMNYTKIKNMLALDLNDPSADTSCI